MGECLVRLLGILVLVGGLTARTARAQEVELIQPRVPLLELSDEEFLGAYARVIPVVERLMERPLLTTPEVGLASLEEVIQALVDKGWSEAEARERVEAVLGSTAAFYEPERQLIAVVNDHLTTNAWAYLHLAPEGDTAAMALLECELAHELAHAIQFQHLSPDPGADLFGWLTLPEEDTQEALRILIEGQAVVVGEQACRELGHGWLVDVRRPVYRGTRSDVSDPLALRYGHGPEVVRLLQRDGGQERVWQWLEVPPPTVDTLFEDTFEAEVQDMRIDPELVDLIIEELTGQPPTFHGPADARHVLWAQDPSRVDLLHPSARVQVRGALDQGDVQLIAWDLRGREVPFTVLDRHLAALEGRDDVKLRRSRACRRHVSDCRAIGATISDHLQEIWVATEDGLLVLLWAGELRYRRADRAMWWLAPGV